MSFPHENETLWCETLCIEDVWDFLTAYPEVSNYVAHLTDYPEVEDDMIELDFAGKHWHFSLPSQNRDWRHDEAVVTVVEHRQDGLVFHYTAPMRHVLTRIHNGSLA